ncbi:putative DNA-binding transcriptional regulator YafY [Paenibacillus taihuensis]|uniref:Putative DNA-binding transcriptional regulator YafY n=1 Tax=Paenibacillus taihuensis TaxID=1156355 RepID=A0A3D9Q952_9BACL|nr:YafY family protein [Paenibacillus taihuensis]REE56467.1 putative DNA-binding transcriptional regulator YafY [Paenibacillus taihuensis]
MSKADNMLAILWLLKTNKRMTAKQLADALEMHIRTVYRYIDALCASGVPIVADAGHNGGYSLLEHFKESPLFFDLEEQKALVQAALFAEEAGYPYGDALKRAITKLKRYTNEEQRSELDRHSNAFEVVSASPASTFAIESHLQQLEQAVASCSTQIIDYRKGFGLDIEQRSINPYGLIHWRGKWYIIGYCLLREDIRSFRVDRIQAITGTDDRYERPADFSARDFLRHNMKPWLTSEEQLIRVVIQGNPRALESLAEHWMFDGSLIERTSDEAHFMMDEKSLLTYIPYHLISYGMRIQVLEPQLLREHLVELMTKLLAFYQNPTNFDK